MAPDLELDLRVLLIALYPCGCWVMCQLKFRASSTCIFGVVWGPGCWWRAVTQDVHEASLRWQIWRNCRVCISWALQSLLMSFEMLWGQGWKIFGASISAAFPAKPRDCIYCFVCNNWHLPDRYIQVSSRPSKSQSQAVKSRIGRLSYLLDIWNFARHDGRLIARSESWDWIIRVTCRRISRFRQSSVGEN